MGRPQMGMYILNQGLSKTGIICGCTVLKLCCPDERCRYR